jgi:multiple sugar transport system permease protein
MRRQAKETLAGFLFVSPWLVGFVLLTAGPMIASLIFSFANYNFTSKFEWVGLKNYVRMLTSDYDFWNSIGVTFRWVFIREPIFLILGLCAALLVNRKTKGVGIYRTLFYVPSLMAGTVSTAVMWKMLLAKNGQVNALLALVGFESVAWFQDPRTAMGALIVTSFISFGGPMVIFLAGLKNIPEVYYEAATIDGANAWQKFFRITIPMLSPVLFFQAIMGAIWAFQSFTVAFVISAGGGGPAGKTMFYLLNLYRNAFKYYRAGYASALAWGLFVIILVFTLFMFRSSNLWVFYETEVRVKKSAKAL